MNEAGGWGLVGVMAKLWMAGYRDAVAGLMPQHCGSPYREWYQYFKGYLCGQRERELA